MPRINPEGQLTRAERLATVIAIAGAIVVHVVVILGWGRLSRWTQEEQKKERLMVIRRVRDVAPPPETLPLPPRQRLAPGPAGEEGIAAPGRRAAPPPPPPTTPKVREPGPEPSKESELSPPMEQELQEQPPDQGAAPEQGDNSISVVTDLPAASFLVVGAGQQYRGSGTLWVRKGAPAGVYTATFNPVAGFSTPPVQTKELVAKGQIVFVGKYRRSTEIKIASNVSTASVTVYRPDKRTIDLDRPGITFVDDLPQGTYTAVFKDMPPLITPPPASQNLTPGGRLSFYGEYGGVGGGGQGSGRAGSGREGDGDGSGDGTAGRGSGRGGGSGSGAGSGRKTPAPAPEEGGLDRRVQMIVKSYPSTEIEQDFKPIPYPEVIIRRSNFQQGWCQVYLIVDVSDGGDVSRVTVERPNQESRAQFAALIGAVEAAVRSWDYDRVSAEVHVDVRFYVE